MRCIEAGEDLRVGGEKLRESAQDLGIMVLGFEALSLIGGRVDDDDVVGSSAHETAPGFEEIVREVACSLANLGGEVEVMVFPASCECAAGHIEVYDGLGSSGNGGDGERAGVGEEVEDALAGGVRANPIAAGFHIEEEAVVLVAIE